MNNLVDWCRVNAALERERAPAFAAKFDEAAALIEELEAAMTRIAEGYGHCADCEMPCEHVTECDCAMGWEPDDPREVARAALTSTSKALSTGGEEA